MDCFVAALLAMPDWKGEHSTSLLVSFFVFLQLRQFGLDEFAGGAEVDQRGLGPLFERPHDPAHFLF